MTQLRLFVFGPPRLERDGHPVELGLRRALALLVYLAVSRQPQSRDTLATLLWPDSDQREARANLRRTLHRLGQAIGDDLLATSAETVGVAPGAPLWVDSQAFLDLAGSAEGQEAAARLYGDDFLAGFSLPDSPAFDEWQFFERERLRQLLAQTLEQLTMGARARGAWDAAADHARRWVALDVLHEPAQRALLEAYAQAGQAAAAIRQYQELARTLEAELGAEPEEATTALFEAIRTRRFPPPSSPPPAEAPRPAHVAPAPPPPAAPPLVGRERELGDLLGLLGAEGGPRLVTLTGPGGAGKTRLAQAVVEQSGPRLAHGAQLVSLAEVAGPEGIAPAIAARLGLPAGDGDLEARLLGALHERELLLALDNFEHLLDGAALVAAILAAAPRARLLVTSRERLGVADEAVYPLGGLELPADDDGGSALEAASARLLLQRARLVRPELAPGPADVAAIARICRLVQGMPLALTLAASWAELLSFDEIAGEIGRSLDFLATDQRGVPERQRSVRAVFEGSWRRLPADVQRVFARLTVFHGGFTRRAAEAVAGAGLPALRRLVNSSFITVSDQAQRYEIHELLRQLAAEAAEGDPDVAAARGRHAALYLAMVGGLTANLKGPGQKQAVLALDADADNLRAAWRHAAAQGDRAALAGAAEGLWLYWELRGALREGEGLLREAADVVEAAGGADAAGLAGFLRAGQGHLAARRGEWAAGSATMEQGVALLRAASAASPGWLALALLQLGFLNRFQERHGEAARLGEESLALFAAADDSWGVAYSLLLMGTALERQGKPALAAQLLQTCLERARELEDAATCSFAAWNLGRARMSFGDFAQARRLFDEAIALAGELGHTLSLGSALMERGLLGLTTGALEQAEADFAAGAGHFAAIGAVWEEAWARTGLGAVAHGRGELERAEAQLRAGLRAARSIGRPWHTARCLSVLGLVALDRGDRPAAVALQREALAMMREAGHEPRVALCATRLAGALLAHGQADDEARGLLHEALALSLRHQLAPTAIEACVVATRLALTDGRLGEALEVLTLAAAHPSASAGARRIAGQLAAPCAEELGTDGAAAARERGRRREWRATAQQLLAALDDGAGRQQAPPPSNLDPHLPPLFGRDWELTALLGLLNEPSRRLVTLLGPGGIGKTRLAQEVGLAAHEAFPDGVFFVPLAPVGDPARLAAAIAGQLGLHPSGAAEPREQLLRFLGRKRLLLILDNFEHLLDGAALIPAILRAAPQVAALVTTRERLGLDGELVYTLGGIDLPEGEDDALAMERGAVRLLLQRVREARPGFDPDPGELDAMIRICRLVQGMPLAIILAATWADLLPLSEIAAEIARSLDVLEADLRGLPARQRSVRAVFEASWRRLPQSAQRGFARMSVFRGGFSRQAAEQVAGADLRTLRTLANSSFIAVERDDRYGIHELLRQFGAEQLAALGEAEALRDRHCAYYLAALAAREEDLKGRRQLAALLEIEGDLENVRQAWARALEGGDVAALDRSVEGLYLYFELRSRQFEGGQLLDRACERLLGLAPEPGLSWARAAIRRGVLRSLMPDPEGLGEAELLRCLAIVERAGATADAGLCQLAIGHNIGRAQQDLRRCLPHHERALALFSEVEDRFYVGQLLARLGYAHSVISDLEVSYRLTRQSMLVTGAVGDRVGMAMAAGNLAETALKQGRYDEAKALSIKAEALSGEVDRPSGQGQAHFLLGVLAFLRGDLDEAHRQAVGAFTLASGVNNAITTANALAAQSLVACARDDAHLALRLADESTSMLNNPFGHLLANWGRAMARCTLDDMAGAWEAFGTARQYGRQMSSPAMLTWLLPTAAVVLAARGREERAAELLALARRHPLAATGWTACWRPLADLESQLERSLGPEPFAAASERGAALDITAVADELASDGAARREAGAG